jgi:hypothetical protein
MLQKFTHYILLVFILSQCYYSETELHNQVDTNPVQDVTLADDSVLSEIATDHHIEVISDSSPDRTETTSIDESIVVLLGDYNFQEYQTITSIQSRLGFHTVDLSSPGDTVHDQTLKFLTSDYISNPKVRSVIVQVGIADVLSESVDESYIRNSFRSLISVIFWPRCHSRGSSAMILSGWKDLLMSMFG